MRAGVAHHEREPGFRKTWVQRQIGCSRLVHGSQRNEQLTTASHVNADDRASRNTVLQEDLRQFVRAARKLGVSQLIVAARNRNRIRQT